MMIHQAMNNQNSINTAKTAEIMSRYRPIAPKPDLVPTNPASDGGSPESQKIRQSPYLRNVWAHLQARPTRTRKRGRTSLGPSPVKRSRTAHLFGLPPPCHLAAAQNLSIHGFADGPEAQSQSTLVTLPLLQCPIMAQAHETESGKNSVIDLNRLAEVTEERDFLKLQSPISPEVIAPQPIRPVGSSISVGSISEESSLGSNLNPAAQVLKKREEVESEVESEELPAVVSDSNNKVRLANSAYKEMVGQPECPWLDSMVAFSSGKRICGEVMLRFLDTESMPVKSNGFSCWVTIEWGSSGKSSGSVHAFCEVMRLSCESKDYLFEWRFHTREATWKSAGSKAS